MKTKKINYKQEPYGYTRHIEQVVNYNAEVLEDALNRINKLEKTKLSALQPVTPAQRWIPVSERLPEVMEGTMGDVSNDVLMCVTDTDGEGITISTGFYGYYPNCSAMRGWWCMWAHGCTKLNNKCKVVA